MDKPTSGEAGSPRGQGAASLRSAAESSAPIDFRDSFAARGRILVEDRSPGVPQSADGAGEGLNVEYEILERAGSEHRSGEGMVFKARRRPMQGGSEWERNDIVALKIIFDDLFRLTPGPGRLLRHYARMTDQFHLVRALRHPGLVTPHSTFLIDCSLKPHQWLYDVIDHNDAGEGYSVFAEQFRPVAVTDWVDGVSIAAWNSLRPRDPGERIEVLRSVAQAIDALQISGTAFRDLKPDNLVVRANRAVLVDLGMVAPSRDGRDPREPGPYVDPEGHRSTGEHRDRFAFAALIGSQALSPRNPWPDSFAPGHAGDYLAQALRRNYFPEAFVRLLAAELHADVRGRTRFPSRSERARAGRTLENLLDASLAALESPKGQARIHKQ